MFQRKTNSIKVGHPPLHHPDPFPQRATLPPPISAGPEVRDPSDKRALAFRQERIYRPFFKEKKTQRHDWLQIEITPPFGITNLFTSFIDVPRRPFSKVCCRNYRRIHRRWVDLLVCPSHDLLQLLLEEKTSFKVATQASSGIVLVPLLGQTSPLSKLFSFPNKISRKS